MDGALFDMLIFFEFRNYLYVISLKGDSMTYVCIILAIVLLALLWSFIEYRMLLVSHYNISSDTMGKDIHNLSFVLLADLHNRSLGKNNKKLIKKILEERPDFVIIAGDMVNKKRPCYPGKAFNLIKDISKHYPVYYAYGNHEQFFEDLDYSRNQDEYKKYKTLYESWSLYKSRLKELGVFLLDNKSISLKYKDSMLTITGLSIPINFFNRRYRLDLGQNELHSKIGSRDRDSYHILIAHNPIFFSDYIEWGADLVLSGHMHGGLLRLPLVGGVISPQVKLFPKYDAGLFSENDRSMIVSKGLGGHSFMPRLFNPPELVHVTLLKGVL